MFTGLRLMFSIYLFTIVFTALCLLVAKEPQPKFAYDLAETNYQVVDDLCTLDWITDFVAEVDPETQESENSTIAEPNTATDSLELTQPNEIAAESEEAIISLDARVKEITEAMTKAAILSDIKRHGWWESNLSRMSKRELAVLKAQREILADSKR